MRWTAPPDRRELSLVLFSLTVFLFAYNLDTSLQLFGIDPETTRSLVFSHIVLGKTKLLGKDGRKPPAWRDPLEREIFGDWAWDEGHVAGDGAERSQSKSSAGRHGATWIGRKELQISGGPFGDHTVDQGLRWWNKDIPMTRVLKHVPGYTIFDNVFLFNGTVYLVKDHRDSFPPMSNMVSTLGNGYGEWQIISQEEAFEIMGGLGGIVRGVSWLSADGSSHNATLLSLWRTYSSLDPAIDSQGRTTLPPPHRLFFPHNRFFTDANPDFAKHWLRRVRVDTGFHPYLAKAAFPDLTMLYYEDWEDYHKMGVPWLLERLVVADRGAASLSEVKQFGHPTWTSAFQLDGSEWWWEPVRRTMAEYFDVQESDKKQVVTYLHRQYEENGPRLEDRSHDALVEALERMGKRYGYEVHIVSTSALEAGWNERMGAVVKSTVVLGVHGPHLLESLFMKLSPHSTLMEFFPDEKFLRDEEMAVTAAGMNYIGWWNTKKFTNEDDLPPVSSPGYIEDMDIDADAVVRSIHEILSR